MSKPVNINDAHRVAFIFLYFATETDNKLATEELMVISDKIEDYITDEYKIKTQLNSWQVVTETLNWYTGLSSENKKNTFSKLILSLKRNFTESQKEYLIKDLNILADSDGEFLDTEKKLIQKSLELLN
ncbi:MAG: hypothetical protein VX770_04390 [Candidatus Neomarinimicrobiota bacterium]|nr:hypothetical protein [Candidatus Neomarinimicrobiota bacterium]|tara:strand:- start:5296 stop:5682 length:387 start_codon:yes stop_codon:yes gene_type:complete